MVLRLLAFNAEAWLAEHFNAYLADPDEYRAILRNLLHLGGNVDYTRNAITVTLERPTAHESPAPCSSSPKSSTSHQRPSPDTAAH